MDQSSDAIPKRRGGKRGHGEGTIGKRPNGTWYARMSLPDGKRKSLYGKTQAEVVALLRSAQRDQERGLDLTAKRQTVSTFLDAWLEETAKPTIRPSTYRSYESNVRIHLKPAIGRVQLSDLSPQHVQKMLNACQTAGLSPRSTTYLRAILRRSLADALRWGLVARNAAALSNPPRAVPKRVQPLSVDQVRTLLEATRDDAIGLLLAVAVTTGLRQGELFGLRWHDVDLTGRVLRVAHAMQRVDGVPTFIEPKTSRSRRTLSLPAMTVDALDTQRRRQLDRRDLLGADWQDWDLVFPSTIGTPLNHSNVAKRLHEVLERAGLPRIRFHDLRHSAASLLLAAGEHPRVVMEILGHSQFSLTMNTYSHVMPAALEGAASRMDALLGGDRAAS